MFKRECLVQSKFFSSGLCWFWVAVLVFLFDRMTKQCALSYLDAYQPYAVLRGFNLTLSFNKGAAFSFLHSASGWQMWFFGAVAVAVTVAILVWLFRLSARDRWMSIALSLVAGGALGNLWDRIQYGHVIDFIEVYAGQFYWPVFNIADSAVCIGAVMLFLHSFMKQSQKK